MYLRVAMVVVVYSPSKPTLVTPWTVACQAPVSMEFPGKNTGADCHFLLQGIFPIQGYNQGLLHCRQILYQLSYEGSPKKKANLINEHRCKTYQQNTNK